MSQRFLSIWFRHLTTDWFTLRHPELKNMPFVLVEPERGRMLIKAASKEARLNGILPGMVVADARAVFPSLQVFDETPELSKNLLEAIATWCLRYAPIVAVDMPDGTILDISGCAHLWGGERLYLLEIITRFRDRGYDVRAAIADSIGAAWAIARFGRDTAIIPADMQLEALLSLPPAALRLNSEIVNLLEKLGLYQVRNFINMPRKVLRRRFGTELLTRIDQALGAEREMLQPVQPSQPYQERLPCLEPVRTAIAIEIALKKLLETLCQRFAKEEKGLRKAVFKGYRIDGKIVQIEIGTSKPSRNVIHLFKLFELKITHIEPDLGIELFLLEAPIVENLTPAQEALWHSSSHDQHIIAELLDKIEGKMGKGTVHRYLPQEHYWPERSIKLAITLDEKPQTAWRTDIHRPVHLLTLPEAITVMVPLPDYPPVHFTYKSVIHRVKKADGPERIEREWWMDAGQHRDYYAVEDEEGCRYWIFRLGHYNDEDHGWFLHGFFA